MPKKRPGKICRFIKKDGSAQYAIAYDDNQNQALLQKGRLSLVLTDTDYNPIKREGKIVGVIKTAKDLKFIGLNW